MESIAVEVIREHVKDKIYEGQHGFLAGKSTVTQLLETLNEWTNAVDRGSCIDILYIDISKAFDSVSHPKLLQKLFRLGISGKLLQWVKAFLSNRWQKVIVDGHESGSKSVSSSVPQGSVLGPLLFLLYINDLPTALQHHKMKLFADDAKAYMIFKRDSNTFERFNGFADTFFSE